MYPIADMHCDTIVCAVGAGEGELRKNDCHIDLEKLRAGGSMLQCFALYMTTPDDTALNPDRLGFYDFFLRSADLFDSEMRKNADLITPVRSYDEVMAAHGAGRLAALMTVEDAAPLEGDLARLDAIYARGVRLITLLWNRENSLGFPNPQPDTTMRGLKPFGIEAVRRMNELGIIVDVSHLSDGGFFDVAKYSKKPFVASHSNARALCPVPRDLTDDMLKLIGNAGGVVGVNFSADFLRQGAVSKDTTYMADVARHARYIADKAGIESVGFGSDYDGIGSTLEWRDASGMQALVSSMESVFTPRELDLISHRNVLRVLRDCCN